MRNALTETLTGMRVHKHAQFHVTSFILVLYLFIYYVCLGESIVGMGARGTHFTGFQLGLAGIRGKRHGRKRGPGNSL
jgi:hypothetical protein